MPGVSHALLPRARSAQQRLWTSQFPVARRCGRDARGPRGRVVPPLWE